MSSGWLIFFALGGDILVLFAVVFALKVLWWLLWEVFRCWFGAGVGGEACAVAGGGGDGRVTAPIFQNTR